MRNAWGLLKKVAQSWMDHNAPRLGAALAYYTILSLAPLLVLVVAIAGFAFGSEAARGELVHQVQIMVGGEGARFVESLLKGAQHPTTGIAASIMGVITLLIGASAVFGELRDSLNLIWDAKPAGGSGIWAFLKYRLFSFAIVIAVGFLLLVSLVLSAGIAFAAKFMSGAFQISPAVVQAAELGVSLVVVTLLFAMTYKYIPDVPVQWRDVWIGAAVTSVLFTIGKFALGLYLGKASVGSAYGAAGSLVIMLVWVYYSSQLFFFGAEFTRAIADRHATGRLPGT